ncbi:MAG: hypothetical protein ACNYVW_07190 [Methanosarcinales archaeon]
MKNEAKGMKTVKKTVLLSLPMWWAKREEGERRGGARYKYPNI